MYIGNEAAASGSGATNEIAIGYAAVGNGSNSVVIGNSSITDVYLGGGGCTNGVACGIGQVGNHAGAASATVGHAQYWNSYSDERLKKDIHDSDLGLDFILKLRPVSYVFKVGNSLMNYGFIAQEVEKALGGRISGIVTRQKDAMGTYELNYSSIIAPLVKAVQELKSTDDSNTAELKQLITIQQKEIDDLRQQVRVLAARPAPERGQTGRAP